MGFLTNPSMVTGKRQRAWCSHLLSVAPQMRDAGRFWQITFHGHEVIVANSRVKAFINMSQMTLSQMSISETTASPQHKLHWLAEQALNWSGLPVVHVRPTVFLEGFFLILASDSVRESNQIRLPFGEGKTSPVAAEDWHVWSPRCSPIRSRTSAKFIT